MKRKDSVEPSKKHQTHRPYGPAQALPPEIPVFVYGTLKKGLSNHHYLEGGNATFLGQAITKKRFALYADLYPYVYPKEAISHIKGEVYLVDKETLARLDALEEHPDWYYREKTRVILEDGREMDAFIYFHDEPSGRLIPSGCYG